MQREQREEATSSEMEKRARCYDGYVKIRRCDAGLSV